MLTNCLRVHEQQKLSLLRLKPDSRRPNAEF